MGPLIALLASCASRAPADPASSTLVSREPSTFDEPQRSPVQTEGAVRWRGWSVPVDAGWTATLADPVAFRHGPSSAMLVFSDVPFPPGCDPLLEPVDTPSRRSGWRYATAVSCLSDEGEQWVRYSAYEGTIVARFPAGAAFAGGRAVEDLMRRFAGA